MVCVLLSAPALAEPLAHETGLRIGDGDGFRSTEVYWRQESPWLQAEVLPRLRLTRWRAHWSASIAHWEGDVDNHAMLALGPVLERRVPEQDVRVSLGVRPSLLSGHDGNGEDLGGAFQFTSHVGAAWVPMNALVLGVRIQHTSNAHFYSSNPGVDMVAIEIGYTF